MCFSDKIIYIGDLIEWLTNFSGGLLGGGSA